MISDPHPLAGYRSFPVAGRQAAEDRSNVRRRRRIIRAATDAYVLGEANRGHPMYLNEARRRGLL